MYTIILFGIIGLLFVIINEYRNGMLFDFWDEVPICILGVVAGCAIGFFIAWVLPLKYKTDIWSEKIVNLRSKESVSGNFFLGCGQINGSMKYVYYCQNNDSTYQMWQADYYTARIKYTKGNPIIDITYKHKDENSLWNKFAIDVLENDNDNWSCVFEVPEGTIKNNYSLGD